MIDAQLNYFDMVFIATMLFSCLFAFFRGFVKEILSLIAWVGSGLITLYFFKDVAEILQPHLKQQKTAIICSIIILYIGSLICFAIFNKIIIKILKSGEIGWLDNILGLAFGAVRGALIISLGYFMISLAIPSDKRPKWLENAVTRPYAEQGAIILEGIAPKYLSELSDLQKEVKENIQDSVVEDIKRPTYDRSMGGIEENVDDAEQGGDGAFERVLENLSR